jgi:uncharacterized protein YkwD
MAARYLRMAFRLGGTMKRCVLIAAFLLACLPCSSAQEKAILKLSDAEQKLLDIINDVRSKKDLLPFRPDPVLFKVAREHSANMARQFKMDHKLDDKGPFERIKGAGYAYTVAGENIACAEAPITLTDVVNKWMASKAHRENILERNFVETGLGIAKDETGVVYYTQVFGTPAK